MGRLLALNRFNLSDVRTHLIHFLHIRAVFNVILVNFKAEGITGMNFLAIFVISIVRGELPELLLKNALVEDLVGLRRLLEFLEDLIVVEL